MRRLSKVGCYLCVTASMVLLSESEANAEVLFFNDMETGAVEVNDYHTDAILPKDSEGNDIWNRGWTNCAVGTFGGVTYEGASPYGTDSPSQYSLLLQNGLLEDSMQAEWTLVSKMPLDKNKLDEGLLFSWDWKWKDMNHSGADQNAWVQFRMWTENGSFVTEINTPTIGNESVGFDSSAGSFIHSEVEITVDQIPGVVKAYDIRIFLESDTQAAGEVGFALIDNVRLETLPVPEPASASLMALAATVTLIRRKK
ncbi:PEP-CTERM sorting domain-containing protein [Planctomycetota bacterium]|nr:PEP-CTERM sorting domain-containing protein [Planctomycetota bacterium]